MGLYRNRYRIESARCPGWDYTSNGGYFVTICTKNRQCWFGEVRDGEMHLSAIGAIAQQYWGEIPQHCRDVQLDAFVLMPNHVHGILIIDNSARDKANSRDRDGYGDRCLDRRRRDVACNVSTTTTVNETTQQGLRDGADLSRMMSAMSPKAGSLGAIVRSYKAAVTRWSRQHGFAEFGWQPRFCDRIIRDEAAARQIRRYIENNPVKWASDENNPAKPIDTG